MSLLRWPVRCPFNGAIARRGVQVGGPTRAFPYQGGAGCAADFESFAKPGTRTARLMAGGVSRSSMLRGIMLRFGLAYCDCRGARNEQFARIYSP